MASAHAGQAWGSRPCVGAPVDAVVSSSLAQVRLDITVAAIAISPSSAGFATVRRGAGVRGWAPYVGCIIATLGAVLSAAFAADTVATVLVAFGAMLPVVWAIRPESRDISGPPKISPAS